MLFNYASPTLRFSLFLQPSQELAPKENRNVDLLASPCYAFCNPAYARRPKANRNVDFVRIREGPRDALNRKVSGPYRACLFLCPQLVLSPQCGLSDYRLVLGSIIFWLSSSPSVETKSCALHAPRERCFLLLRTLVAVRSVQDLAPTRVVATIPEVAIVPGGALQLDLPRERLFLKPFGWRSVSVKIWLPS